MKKPFQPSRILLLKGHSAGIGDLLRGSAAWRVLKNQWPEAELHLLFLTRERGYASEKVMRDHHLLKSFTVIDKRARNVREWRRFWAEIDALGRALRPDLVIDFETNGIRTSLISFWMARRYGALTVGINAFPGRPLFYSRSAPDRKKYAEMRGIAWPMDYTERDFAPLAALGLERNGTPIELQETAAGRQFRESLYRQYGLPESERLLGLNIGCGTAGAEDRRPSLPLLAKLVAHVQRTHGLRLVLGLGAPFETGVDQEFLKLLAREGSFPVIDLGCKPGLDGLNGIMKACALFISSDSGPYHMAVASRTPSLAIFTYDCREAIHKHTWVRCVIAKKLEDLPKLTAAADELLAATRPVKS